jgi:hypothetical protein
VKVYFKQQMKNIRFIEAEAKYIFTMFQSYGMNQYNLKAEHFEFLHLKSNSGLLTSH